MLLFRTLSVSPSPWSNQLRRLFFATSRLPGGHGFRFLQLQRMDSSCSSANGRALPDSPCYGNGSSCGSNEEHLHNRNHKTDVVFVGSIPVYLNPKEHELKSLSESPVNKCDGFELGRDKKGIPACVPSSYNEDGKPVSRQNTKKSSQIDLGLERDLKNNASSIQVKMFELLDNTSQQDESSLPNQFGKKNEQYYFPKLRSVDIGFKKSVVMDNLLPLNPPFDICSSGRRCHVKRRAYWQVKVGDTENVIEHVDEATNNIVLRPGMVLLKHYITLDEQVNIVKTCQKLGLGPGGFYQPGYNDGAKLRLQMMCLGLDWDPQTRKYENKRTVDGNKPPDIPFEFSNLVEEALKDAHALIKNNCNENNIEDILPTMSPDICIVNFYTTNGRLGLHQDRDESKKSLVSGLPVVSFSIGNSAEFLYGDQRDVAKAEAIVLESGDVLIFGGESRHVFHGVSSIIPKSTPKYLLDRTGIRPGRLNLTFRKY